MQHVIGLALVALQAALMGLLARTVWFPVLIVAIAALGTFTRFRLTLSREQAFLLSSAAAFFFILKHRFSPQDFPIGSEFIRTEIAFIIAQFLLLIEAAQFLIRREDDRLSPVLPALGAVALICIADIQVTNEQRIMTQFFAIAYSLLWAMFLWTGRTPLPVPPVDFQQETRRLKAQTQRRATAGMALSVIAMTACAASLGFYELEKKIERWVLGLLSGSSTQVRFSRSAHLGSVAHRKSQAEEDIALWAYSESFPGYLRGAVFARFQASEWKAPMEFGSLDVLPASEPPDGLRALSERESLFAHASVKPKAESRWRYVECWVNGDQESAAFTPLGTTHLITQGDRMGSLPFGVFHLPDLASANPYIACVPDGNSPDSPDFRPNEDWLQIPENYRPELDQLAQEVFAIADTSEEKIQAVERYFQENFQYHLGIEIPAGEDPLVYFLREKPPAHCEYFASAAVLLLRSGGVPARYVTGLVPGEWNPSGGYWAARNRDAHAWAEAYLEPQGWVTVEATPSEGVPSAESPPPRFAFWEALKRDWQRLRSHVAQNRWKSLWSLLVSSWLGAIVFSFFLAFAAYLAIRIPWPWRFRKKTHEPVDPRAAQMRELLARMDGLLRPYGLIRNPGETLHQFARRLARPAEWQNPKAKGRDDSPDARIQQAEETSNWYLDYAQLRYQGHWRETDVDDLRSRLPAS